MKVSPHGDDRRRDTGDAAGADRGVPGPDGQATFTRDCGHFRGQPRGLAGGVTCSRHHEDGGFSQPAGDGSQGGTETSPTRFGLRERLAQPQSCPYGATSGEAAFNAVHSGIQPPAGRNGDTAYIPMSEGQGSSAERFDKRGQYRLLLVDEVTGVDVTYHARDGLRSELETLISGGYLAMAFRLLTRRFSPDSVCDPLAPRCVRTRCESQRGGWQEGDGQALLRSSLRQLGVSFLSSER